MNHVGIDVEIHSKANIIRRLARLASTHSVTDRGAYHQARDYAQIRLVTTKTIDEIEDWLYRLTGDYTAYVGAFEIGETAQ